MAAPALGPLADTIAAAVAGRPRAEVLAALEAAGAPAAHALTAPQTYADPFLNAQTSRVWIQGDLHAENFGTYMDGAGQLIFDVNDFDEAFVGHFTWDLQRFAASVALSSLVGWFISRPILKLTTNYLAMATLAFGVIVFVIFKEDLIFLVVFHCCIFDEACYV